MKDCAPKVFAVDYANILNNAVLQFLDENNDKFFIENFLGFTRYVYSGGISRLALRKMFERYIDDEIQMFKDDIRIRFDELPVKTIVVLDSCLPSCNILPNDFDPERTIKYSIVEPDIKLDFNLFEPIWDRIFIDKFKNDTDKDVLFFHNKRLNSQQLRQIIYSIFKTSFYGKEYPIRRRIIEDANKTTTFGSSKDLEHSEKIKAWYVAKEVKAYLEKRLVQRILPKDMT